MVKRIAIAAVCGAVVTFVLAGLSFGLLFAGFFASHFPEEFAGVNRTAVNFPLIVVADLLYATMLAFVLDRAGVRTAGRGALYGAFIGFMVVLHFDLLWAATTYLTTPPAMAANVAISTAMSAAAGAVIATALGWSERRAK